MISKIHRFHGHSSLNFVYRKGKPVRGDLISLKIASSRRDDFRMAVVVSKKVSKSAVVRNRIRRRVYEVIRTMHKDNHKTWSYDLVFTVQDAQVATISSEELRTIITQLVTKANV